MDKGYTYVYDDACPICVRSANVLRNIFSNSQSGFEILGGANYAQKYNLASPGDVLLICPDGEFLTGADAVEKILEIMPMARPFRWLLSRTFLKKAHVPAYTLMKTVRKSCGRCP